MRVVVLLGIALSAIFAPNVIAHSGRTDASGCHTCRTNCSKYGLRNGQYHCHGGGRSSASSQVKPAPPPAPIKLFREDGLSASPPQHSISLRRSRANGVEVDVLAIVDGDTFVAREGERLYLLKLRDLEAPEPEQPYGFETRRRLSNWLLNRRIVVWPEKAQGCVIPVQAKTLEGTDLSEQLLAEGLAWAARSAPESRRDLEADARLERLGLWQGSEPEPPWEYRARRTMARKSQSP